MQLFLHQQRVVLVRAVLEQLQAWEEFKCRLTVLNNLSILVIIIIIIIIFITSQSERYDKLIGRTAVHL